ncbi:MAG: DUF1592 domain-containing protein [Planctomycetota bacterium]
MRILQAILLTTSCLSWAAADSFHADVTPLVQSSCIACHDADTDTGLNFDALGQDLADSKTFRHWERVFDRVAKGEMPPKSEDRPDAEQVERALTSLKRDLRRASQARRSEVGRVPARRLTKLELGYTLRDLLSIQSDVTSGIPDEVESGSFDTVGASQRISAVHMESYLEAADQALREAIQLGRNPHRFAKTSFAFLDQWHDKPLNLGGSITRRLQYGDGVVLFRDVDYLTAFQFQVTMPGIHRLTARLAAYQTNEPLTAKFIVKDQTGGAKIVQSIDLMPGEPTTVIVDTFLKPGDTPYVTFDMGGTEPFQGIQAAGGSRNFKGRGLAILSQTAEGPLLDDWPPLSTRHLLSSVDLQQMPDGRFEVEPSANVIDQISDSIQSIAPRVFRRAVDQEQIERFVDLARPAVDEGRGLVEALQVPLRSMLSSPQFLMFGGDPGVLDDHALASRLSYFLWKSMPDQELFTLAASGELSSPEVLSDQVDRMLVDEKSNRFVRDFLGQWLRLHKVNATTPDDGLYPEYDELLADAILREPELFFTELIKENLSLNQLIDSDFTFVNRRLASHYGIAGVEGQSFRRVSLPDGSPRGGVLTQAAVLKTTANGTTTSPVMRGNFVLTNFLGTPPSPPPPGVGSIEPDTRGKTTIREILDAHRELDTCNQCHQEIDPPGFALESFDPIGGFRTHYRASGGETTFDGFTVKLPPKQGPRVDAAGVTSAGDSFQGIEDFKNILMQQNEQVARHFISQLVVYSTGSEIQFADREDIEAILDQTRPDGFLVRDIIHAVVQCQLFRNK